MCNALTVTIRASQGSRDTLNQWCHYKNCTMPKLIEDMIEYIERKKQVAFYNSLESKPLAGKRIQK